jgi:hypothetical protein
VHPFFRSRADGSAALDWGILLNTAKKKSVFAVCDTEMEYARNFMEYLNQKRNIPFEVHAFSSAEMFLEFAKNNETEILLISDKAMKEEIRRYPIRQIIILSEGVHSPVLDQYPAVYKYQSSEKVIREVMACYGVENGVDTSPALLPKKEMRIIGIYSPVGRTQKTSFALTMGQILAKERAVLYLNMESYSGFERSEYDSSGTVFHRRWCGSDAAAVWRFPSFYRPDPDRTWLCADLSFHHSRDTGKLRCRLKPGNHRHPDGLCLRRNLPDAAGFRRSRPAYFLRTVSGIPDGHFDSDGCNGRADAPRNGGKEKFL